MINELLPINIVKLFLAGLYRDDYVLAHQLTTGGADFEDVQKFNDLRISAINQ